MQGDPHRMALDEWLRTGPPLHARARTILPRRAHALVRSPVHLIYLVSLTTTSHHHSSLTSQPARPTRILLPARLDQSRLRSHAHSPV